MRRRLASRSREVMNGSAREKLPECNFLPHCSPLFAGEKKKKKEEVKPRVPAVPRGELKKPKQNVRTRNDIGKTRQVRDTKEGRVRNDFMERTRQRHSNRREMSEDAACS